MLGWVVNLGFAAGVPAAALAFQDPVLGPTGSEVTPTRINWGGGPDDPDPPGTANVYIVRPTLLQSGSGADEAIVVYVPMYYSADDNPGLPLWEAHFFENHSNWGYYKPQGIGLTSWCKKVVSDGDGTHWVLYQTTGASSTDWVESGTGWTHSTAWDGNDGETTNEDRMFITLSTTAEAYVSIAAATTSSWDYITINMSFPIGSYLTGGVSRAGKFKVRVYDSTDWASPDAWDEADSLSLNGRGMDRIQGSTLEDNNGSAPYSSIDDPWRRTVPWDTDQEYLSTDTSTSNLVGMMDVEIMRGLTPGRRYSVRITYPERDYAAPGLDYLCLPRLRFRNHVAGLLPDDADMREYCREWDPVGFNNPYGPYCHGHGTEPHYVIDDGEKQFGGSHGLNKNGDGSVIKTDSNGDGTFDTTITVTSLTKDAVNGPYFAAQVISTVDNEDDGDEASATAWSSGGAVTEGNYYKPTVSNGLWYEAGGTGTFSAGPEPTWPTTLGGTVVDNTITFTARGKFADVTLTTEVSYERGQENWITFEWANPFNCDLLFIGMVDRTSDEPTEANQGDSPYSATRVYFYPAGTDYVIADATSNQHLDITDQSLFFYEDIQPNLLEMNRSLFTELNHWSTNFWNIRAQQLYREAGNAFKTYLSASQDKVYNTVIGQTTTLSNDNSDDLDVYWRWRYLSQTFTDPDIPDEGAGAGCDGFPCYPIRARIIRRR